MPRFFTIAIIAASILFIIFAILVMGHNTIVQFDLAEAANGIQLAIISIALIINSIAFYRSSIQQQESKISEFYEFAVNEYFDMRDDLMRIQKSWFTDSSYRERILRRLELKNVSDEYGGDVEEDIKVIMRFAHIYSKVSQLIVHQDNLVALKRVNFFYWEWYRGFFLDFYNSYVEIFDGLDERQKKQIFAPNWLLELRRLDDKLQEIGYLAEFVPGHHVVYWKLYGAKDGTLEAATA